MLVIDSYCVMTCKKNQKVFLEYLSRSILGQVLHLSRCNGLREFEEASSSLSTEKRLYYLISLLTSMLNL